MTQRVVRCAAVVAALIVASACDGDSVALGTANVRFRITSNVGPCSSSISVRFDVDGVAVGEEDFNINGTLAESSLFPMPAGTHTLGAQITRWGTNVSTNGYTWPDTVVTLVPNQTLVHSIDLYCS